MFRKKKKEKQFKNEKCWYAVLYVQSSKARNYQKNKHFQMLFVSKKREQHKIIKIFFEMKTFHRKSNNLIQNLSFFALETNHKYQHFPLSSPSSDPHYFSKNITRTPTTTGGGSCVGKYALQYFEYPYWHGVITYYAWWYIRPIHHVKE